MFPLNVELRSLNHSFGVDLLNFFVGCGIYSAFSDLLWNVISTKDVLCIKMQAAWTLD